MGKKTNNSNQISRKDNELLNFRFARTPSTEQPRRRSGRNHNVNRWRSRNNGSHYHTTAEDRAAPRRKAANNMFPLHSSPDHAFIISRRGFGVNKYSFQGCDEAVSWESVKVVKFLVSATHEETCPICLDSLQCSRITKCGHCFCLHCLVRYTQSLNQKAPKCPCCAVPFFFPDIRPLQLVSVDLPKVNSTVKFVKLHREKACASPYLPLPNQPRRVAPASAPCSGDADAPYCRFNYVDPEEYQRLLNYNHQELTNLQQEESSSASEFDLMCLCMAQQMIQLLMNSFYEEVDAEVDLSKQLLSPASGVYQCHPPRLFKADSSSGCSVSHSKEQRNKANLATPTSIHSIEAKLGGQMYTNDEESSFYQAEDGSLCFLSGFNMKCLRTEFSSTVPKVDRPDETALETLFLTDTSASTHDEAGLPPLPDVVEGQVLEVERVHVSAELRSRRRFLAHLPIHSDVIIVEINIAHILGKRTKTIFKKEFKKKETFRLNQRKTAQRDADRDRLKHEAQINFLKGQTMRVDPIDHFFHSSPPTKATPFSTGEALGPPVAPQTTAIALDERRGLSSQSRTVSYSRIIQERNNSPASSVALSESNFPTLCQSLSKDESVRRHGKS